MKRATMWLLMALCLGGCASPLRAADSPGQVLSAALQATSALKTAHADYARALTYHLPVDYPWPPATLGMPPHTFKLDASGTGEAAFPDRYHYMVTVRLGPSFHTEMELISIQGITYEQDGVHIDIVSGATTPTWSKPKNPQNLLPVDPFKTLQSLRGTVSPRDLGDTAIAGVRVHHYAMEMDQAKLIAEETSALADPSLRSALQDAIQKGTFHVEVWIGVDDHLIRRISTDEARKETIALERAQTNSALPPGASEQGIVTIGDQIVLNLQDFNSPVTITTPPNVR
jgi:hypothetical protein